MTATGQDRLARAAAALRPYLLRYADYELETLARIVLNAAAEPPGQDGERLVTDPRDAVYDELVAGALAGICPDPLVQKIVDRARAAVGPDLDQAGYDRARRECADELPRLPRTEGGVWGSYVAYLEEIEAARDRWSSSGRAPAGEEEQR